MATDAGARADVVKLVAIALAIATAIYSMAPVGRAIPRQHHERPDSPTLPSRVPQPQSSDAALSAPASQWWHGEECHPASALPALDDRVCGELSNATDAHVARLFVNITPPTTEHVSEFDVKAFANFSRLAFAKQLCELQQFSGCMTWIAGRMDLNKSAATAQPLPFDPRCSTFPDGRVDLDACAASIVASVQQYHGTALVHALARRTNGTVIVFTGDSVTRQLFLAFIAVLRGQLAFASEPTTPRLAPYLEHYFHSDAQYTLLSDGRDYLDIGPEHWAEVACEAGRHGTTAAPVYLSVCFAWDPFQRHIKFRRTVPLIAALERNSTSVAAIVHILPYQWANAGLRASRAVEPRSRPARGKKHLFPEDAHLHMESVPQAADGHSASGLQASSAAADHGGAVLADSGCVCKPNVQSPQRAGAQLDTGDHAGGRREWDGSSGDRRFGCLEHREQYRSLRQGALRMQRRPDDALRLCRQSQGNLQRLH
jgi:hypothetical protein